uniref:Uncharacterized protein n=1 Tax=Panagrolaimus superbus TaxID=310955 RepID=A0A914YB11_9BILA
MQQKAFEHLQQKIQFVYAALTDIGSIKTFDYEAFISYVTWSTMISNASLTDRRIILSFIYIFIGLMAGYYYPQKFNHGSGDFFLPLISNFLFYFLAQNLKDNRLILLGICVFVPASMSAYYAYIFDSFSFLFFVNLFQSSFYIYFCLQLAIRAYSEIGVKSERDIFKMVIRIAVVSEFLGSLSFLASFATS